MTELELKKIQNLITAANILIVISIFIMGIPLGLMAIICALIAWRKFKQLVEQQKLDENLKNAFSKKITMLLILCFAIFAINCVSAYMLYPYMTEIVNQMLSQSGASTGSASTATSGSIWG